MPSEGFSRFRSPDAAAEGNPPSPGRGQAPRTLLSLLNRPADEVDRPALVVFRDGATESWSYAELRRMVGRLAAGLRAAGLRPEEPVALIAPNRPEWVAAYFAILGAGGLPVPIDPLMGDGDLGRVLPHSGCRRIFTTAGHAARLRRIDEGLARQFILFDEAKEEAPDVSSWQQLLAAEPAPLAELPPDRPASLLYTSGTTGVPKGVPLSHANFIANVDALAEEDLARSEDRVLLPLPLHHVYPFTVGLLTPLAIGATVVMPSGMAGPQILQALRQSGATIMIAVPRLLTAILTGITAQAAGRGRSQAMLFQLLLALSRWLLRRFGWRIGRRVFHRLHAELAPNLALLASGGARLEPETELTLGALGWEVLTGYGLTETAPILTFNPRGRARIGSAGLPVRGVELQIARAPHGAPDKEDGEILARGPNVFSGYWNNPEANAGAFTPDGWFRTGDLGHFDRDGYLYLVGRVKEMVVLASGKNVLPEDVEKAYLESPYFKEIGVLERNGQLVGLIVPDIDALRDKGTGRAETLLRDEVEAVSRRLPPYQRLSGYAVTRQPLPRTPIGKLRRHLLAEMYTAAVEGREAPTAEEPSEADKELLESPLGKAVWEWLEGRFPGRTLTLDTSPQLDLGMDSLEWVSLGLEMQARFGIELTEEAIARVVTLRDLLQEVEKAKAVSAGKAAEGRGPAQALTPEQERWLRPLGPGLLLLSFLLYGLNWLAMHLLFRLEVRGRERLPQSGRVIFAPNHTSYLDPFALSAALPWRLLRRTYWAGAVDVMFTTRAKRLFSRLSHVFPVDPYRGTSTSIAYGTAVLGEEKGLVWFPEGRRSPTGDLLPFLPGIGVLVQRTKAPVVPVRIEGSFEALPVSGRWPRLRRIRVTFGHPLGPEKLVREDGEAADAPGAIARSIQDAVAALAPERRREAPPD